MKIEQLRKLAGLPKLLETNEDLVPHFSLRDEENAGKAAIAIARAGISVNIEEALDIFYFNFRDRSQLARAKNIAEKVIDKTKEED